MSKIMTKEVIEKLQERHDMFAKIRNNERKVLREKVEDAISNITYIQVG